jgi:hypothetical protein
VNVLLVAREGEGAGVEAELAGDFTLARAADAAGALAMLGREPAEAVVLHFGIGEEAALDVISGCKRLPAGAAAPGVVVVAASIAHRALVELVRTGAYDVLVEGALEPRELPHAVRNAAYYAKTSAWLAKRKPPKTAPQEVWLIGSGDSAYAAAMLLEASGVAVRQFARAADAAATRPPSSVLVVDLAALGDGEALLRLLGRGAQ